MIDFADTGEIGLLIDQNSVALREATIGRGGILPGKELAFIFGTLRATDLIWRYVVDSYLKGATPEAFNLLYWDSDSVSLPGPMYCWYARNAYVENKIKEPGATTQCSERIDLSKVNVPMFLLASREDHIVPWQSAYRSKDLMGREQRFVLAASGHVAGVINPPARNRRSYWVNDHLNCDAKNWLESAEEKPGSWWPDWDGWLDEGPFQRHRPSSDGTGQRYFPRDRARARPVRQTKIKLMGCEGGGRGGPASEALKQ